METAEEDNAEVDAPEEARAEEAEEEDSDAMVEAAEPVVAAASALPAADAAGV